MIEVIEKKPFYNVNLKGNESDRNYTSGEAVY